MQPVLSEPRFHNEEAAFEYVEAMFWPNGPVCPHCGAVDRLNRLPGQRTKPSKKNPDGAPVHGLWKCYHCRGQFTVRIGTVFEASHAPLRCWLQAIHLVCSSKKVISTRQLQRTLGGSMKTAWFLGHRIREMMALRSGIAPLGGNGGTVEGDVTYVGRKPGTKVRHGAGHMNPVFTLVERDGSARSFHVPDVTSLTLPAVLRKHADPKAHFRTDEARVFTDPGRRFASHETVKHSADEYERGDVHTNTVEGFFSILKRGVYGVYQHVSEAHLHRYLAEFDFRYSNRAALDIDDEQRAALTVQGAKGKRLTYVTSHKGQRTDQALI
jgi:transposase-like protein